MQETLYYLPTVRSKLTWEGGPLTVKLMAEGDLVTTHTDKHNPNFGSRKIQHMVSV